MATRCTHLDQTRGVEPRTPEGCEECLESGDRWVHLRAWCYPDALPLKRSTVEAAFENAQEARGGAGGAGGDRS